MERFPLQWPSGWPRTKTPVRSRFGKWNAKPTIAQATDFVIHELSLLAGSKQCIISTNLKYKIDGLPYSNQREPNDQGVAVYFKMASSTGGPDVDMVLACDSFDKIGCNIYAIGKTIEAMRGIERWGCSELMNRAFTGFKALPEAKPEHHWSHELQISEDATEEEIKDAYRTLVKKYHPDNQVTGNAEKFIRIKKAYELAIQFEKENA